MGISRSSSIVIAYLMRKFNCGYAYCYNFVKKRRVIICPNFGFSRQLKEFERKLKRGTNDLRDTNLIDKSLGKSNTNTPSDITLATIPIKPLF